MAFRRVDLAHGGQALGSDVARQPHECRPQPPMDVGDFSAEQLADEDVWIVAHSSRQPEERARARVRPPTAGDVLAEDFGRECRRRPAPRLEHDPVLLDEAERLAGGHGRS
jgi:hypothetical protein